METCSEYRRRARVALGGNIFGNTWLYLVLAILAGAVLLSLVAFLFVGPMILVGPISIGICSYVLHAVRGNEMQNKGKRFFDGFGNSVGNNILVGFLSHLFIALWSLLFVIPGIIKAISYSQSYFIALEHPEYEALTCIRESRKMMRGHKWQYFCLQLSFIGWMIVGSLCLGIGVFWVSAYMAAADAAFYEDLKNQPVVV